MYLIRALLNVLRRPKNLVVRHGCLVLTAYNSNKLTDNWKRKAEWVKSFAPSTIKYKTIWYRTRLTVRAVVSTQRVATNTSGHNRWLYRQDNEVISQVVVCVSVCPFLFPLIAFQCHSSNSLAHLSTQRTSKVLLSHHYRFSFHSFNSHQLVLDSIPQRVEVFVGCRF